MEKPLSWNRIGVSVILSGDAKRTAVTHFSFELFMGIKEMVFMPLILTTISMGRKLIKYPPTCKHIKTPSRNETTPYSVIVACHNSDRK